MDLSKIKSSERIIEIVSPKDGSELGVRVTLVSLNDPKLTKIKRKIQDERIRLQSRGKDFKAEDIEDNKNTLIFNAVTGWDWSKDATFHGEKPQFNLTNFNNVTKELPWFRDQIEKAFEDEEAFFRG